MFFNREKYIRLILYLILLILGFVLMSGPQNDGSGQFDERIFSFRRITLAPLLILSAYGGMIEVIMKKKKTCSGKK